MATVVFYEKPGCGGNARQKALLCASGHTLDVRNLLTHPWTPQDLRAFFGDRPVREWFNTSAPAVKSGAVDPAALDEASALDMMVRQPLLIRRPLLQSGTRREVGFDTALIDAWLGLAAAPPDDLEACQRVAGQPSPCSPTAGSTLSASDGKEPPRT